MWFKNLHIFRLLDEIHLTADELSHYLAEQPARSCGKIERTTFGWTSPFGEESDVLVHGANNCLLFAAKKEDKILPTSVVKDHLQEKIKKLEAVEDRKIGAKERRSLFDETAIQLLPQAFSKNSVTFAYLDLNNQWLLIDAASEAKAEELTVLLRNSLGSLKIAPIELAQSIPFSMTEWLLHDAVPSNLTADDNCELRDPEHAKTLIKCVNQDLYTDEVQNHLKAGKQVIKLALTWHDRVSFVLDEKASFKRIRFLDLVQEQAKEIFAEDKLQEFDANFSIFTAEFAEMLPSVFALFGGIIEKDDPVKVAA